MERHISTYVHPGRVFMEQVIEPNNLKIGEVAEMLQVSRLTVSKIVNGKGSITPNIALRIQDVFGGNADFWTRMQNKYDMTMAITEYNKNRPRLRRFEPA